MYECNSSKMIGLYPTLKLSICVEKLDQFLKINFQEFKVHFYTAHYYVFIPRDKNRLFLSRGIKTGHFGTSSKIEINRNKMV